MPQDNVEGRLKRLWMGRKQPLILVKNGHQPDISRAWTKLQDPRPPCGDHSRPQLVAMVHSCCDGPNGSPPVATKMMPSSSSLQVIFGLATLSTFSR